MSKTIAVLGLALTALVSTAAIAANGYGYRYGYHSEVDYNSGGFYIGASAGEIFYKEQGLDTMVPGVAFLQIGEEFNPYLAIEGRIGAGFNGDQFRFYHVEVPLVYGGYLKGMLPVTPWFSAFGIAGVGGVQLRRNYPDFTSNNIGFSAGIGGEFALYGGGRLHAEWARLDRGTNAGFDYSVDQLSIGVSWPL